MNKSLKCNRGADVSHLPPAAVTAQGQTGFGSACLSSGPVSQRSLLLQSRFLQVVAQSRDSRNSSSRTSCSTATAAAAR